MTAFSTSDIPAEIDTVEKLHAWSASILNNLYFDTTIAENIGSATRVAQAAPFEITAADPIQWRFISRCSLPLNKDWQGSDKLYKRVSSLGSASIPDGYKS